MTKQEVDELYATKVAESSTNSLTTIRRNLEISIWGWLNFKNVLFFHSKLKAMESYREQKWQCLLFLQAR